MIPSLKNDMLARPDLFDMDGPIDTQDLDVWALRHEGEFPPCLLHLWHEVGGGDLFETETILSPAGSVALGDDIDTVNAYHYEQGMPKRYLVFHVGTGGISAYDRQMATICQLEPEEDYRVEAVFTSLEAWYQAVLRREYAARYGVPPTF